MWSNISAPTRSSLLQLAGAEQVKHEDENFGSNQDNPSDLNGSQLENSLKQYGSPLMRYKHAVCSAPNGYIYIHGGRFGNLPLDDDIWRFDPHQNNWLQLDTRGCKPPSLQEHTLVEYNERLYIFGGQVSTSNTESSFWCLDLMTNEWRSLNMKSSKFGAHLGPTNRRGHSAVIYGNSIYIYGGFEDFRGSSGQLWEYDLLNERWELRNLSSTSAVHPEPRHSHSAIVYEHNMYIYGGLSNLKPLADLWRWSWRDRRWYKERTRGRSPGQLHGHTAIQAFGSMFVFGGERNGRTTRSLWRLNLANMAWQKVRPKGPRPSPTTWHGAIANPLSILDETNYIIEGDSEMLKLSNNGSQGLETYAFSNGPQGDNNNAMMSNPGLECPISRSKSSSIETNGAWSQPQQPQPVVSARPKRKSRLSFLRRNRQDRPRSTHELKQIQMSASTDNFSLPGTNRHSIHFAPITNGNNQQPKLQQQPPLQPKVEPETNVKILDNLDIDIKEMFQRAMSPSQDNEMNDEQFDEDGEPMSVDTTIHQPSIGMTSATTRRSQYETARQTEGSLLLARGENPAYLRGAISQRTSYAYTTPPSELNTLAGTSQQGRVITHLSGHKLSGREQSTSFAQNLRGLSTENERSGYNRRNNRPKSEIVQSLIERADAQIKHLYAPFFNQATGGGSGVASSGKRRHHINRLSLDKSKRHTIPQTMTYYNLYFSEDKSSNSPPTSNQEDASMDRDEEDATREELVPMTGEAAEDHTAIRRMKRDDASSSTIRGSASESGRAMAASSGTLVGVHGYLNPAILAQMDQVSQLSLETINSSESRTLCANGPTQDSGRQAAATTNFSGVSSFQSSLQNALTVRRDTASESRDNTSLSFSTISEFEDDDVLQYLSPSDPIIEPNNRFTGNRFPAQDNLEHDVSPSSRFRVSPLAYSGVKGSDTENNKPVEMVSNELIDENHNRVKEEAVVETVYDNDLLSDQRREAMAHKSASSGYDSISGFEQNQLKSHIKCYEKPGSSKGLNDSGETFGASEDTTHEDSTASSFNLTTNTTETSPEQSAQKINQHKKLKGRAFLNRKLINNKQQTITSSSITADSLALTSDGFECSSIEPTPGHHQVQQTKSLPSSPPENGLQRRSDTQITDAQRKQVSTRSKLFGNRQKSKTRYWQLCMFVIGGKQGGAHGINEPINIWRLYI